MSYCFMKLEKIKTETSFKNKYGHNFRTDHVPNADPSKRDDNEELISMSKGETYYSLYQKKIKEASGYACARPRKDAVKGLEVMLTYNASTVSEDFDEDAWKRENIKWLQDTFGKDNVISAVLHKDETTPHIHAVVIPMVNGRLNAKCYTGGKKALSDLQTSYGKSMEKVGLERGLQFSKAEHIDISRFYASLNKTLSQELPSPQKDEKTEEYRKRANQVFVDSNLKHMKEVNDLNRKIQESKTLDINSKIELEKLRKKAKITDKVEKQAQRFEEILNGLKHGYFSTPEENEAFKKQMQDISNWEQEYEKRLNESER